MRCPAASLDGDPDGIRTVLNCTFDATSKEMSGCRCRLHWLMSQPLGWSRPVSTGSEHPQCMEVRKSIKGVIFLASARPMKLCMFIKEWRMPSNQRS